MRKWCVLVAVVLLGAGCVLKVAEKVETTIMLGEPYLDENFSTNGRVYFYLLALTEDSTVIELSQKNVEVEIDSTKPSGSYTIRIYTVEQEEPDKTKISVGLLFDSSGSMGGNDPYMVRKDAARNFLRKLLNASTDHIAGIFDFAARWGDSNNDGIDDYYLRVIYDYTTITDTVGLFGAIDSITASGGTPLYLSTKYLLEHTNNNIDASSYMRALLVFTDGYDNASGTVTSDTVVNLSKLYNIPIFGIGLGDFVDEEFQDAVVNSGGVYANASDAQALDNIFTAMGLGLSQGYSIIIVEISPVPASGTVFYGHITVKSGGGSAVAYWVLNVEY